MHPPSLSVIAPTDAKYIEILIGAAQVTLKIKYHRQQPRGERRIGSLMAGPGSQASWPIVRQPAASRMTTLAVTLASPILPKITTAPRLCEAPAPPIATQPSRSSSTRLAKNPDRRPPRWSSVTPASQPRLSHPAPSSCPRSSSPSPRPVPPEARTA
jgi:hypothetical protein